MLERGGERAGKAPDEHPTDGISLTFDGGGT
jgi:hypothetical protein